jgi:hypothetical protein
MNDHQIVTLYSPDGQMIKCEKSSKKGYLRKGYTVEAPAPKVEPKEEPKKAAPKRRKKVAVPVEERLQSEETQQGQDQQSEASAD